MNMTEALLNMESGPEQRKALRDVLYGPDQGSADERRAQVERFLDISSAQVGEVVG